MKRLLALAALLALLTAMLGGCLTANTGTLPTGEDNGEIPESVGDTPDGNEILSFRPVDCGVQAQAAYDFPFLGMGLTLPQTLLDRIDSREVFAFTQEDYTPEYALAYALLRFSLPTQAQREEEGMSVDIFSWEENLEKLGAIGVYTVEMAAQLDRLTLCDTHTKLGESEDGVYEYYLSTNSAAEGALSEALKAAQIDLYPMHTLDASLGYSAFSEDRLQGIGTLGSFATEDVFGNSYTEAVFGAYDLTLVNVFTTWCSPCVQEIPELEKLRQEYQEKGVRLGIVAVVLDAKTAQGRDEAAIEQAKLLYERSGAAFPFLIPDETDLNGRLTGIASVPESFFVDSSGNIVSEPYIGANSLEGWRAVVDEELGKLQGAAH